MKILVLDLHTGENRRDSKITKILSRYAKAFTLRLFSSEFSYELLESYDAIVLSGSNNMRIYGDSRVRELKPVLMKLASNGVNILGICGGSQVLALTFGYRRYMLREPEDGWYPIHITEQGRVDPLFKGLEDGFMAFESHILAVRCDDKTEILAENEDCIQAILYRSNVRGVQFHPEVSLERGGDNLRKTKMDEGATEAYPKAQESSAWQIFENFVKMT